MWLLLQHFLCISRYSCVFPALVPALWQRPNTSASKRGCLGTSWWSWFELVSKTFTAIEWDTLSSAGFKCGYPGAALAFPLSHWLFPPLCLQSLQKDKMGEAYSEIGMKGEVSLTVLPAENMATENISAFGQKTPESCPGWGAEGVTWGGTAEGTSGVRCCNGPAALEDFGACFYRAAQSCRFMVSPPWAAEAGWCSRIRRASASPSLCLTSDKEQGKCPPSHGSALKCLRRHTSVTAEGEFLALCTNCWGRRACVKNKPSGDTCLWQNEKLLWPTQVLFYVKVSYIYKTFHFLLTHEKRGISKQSLVLRNAEATPTFSISPFFILMLHSQSQAVSMSYGAVKLHHVFWMFLFLEGREHQSSCPIPNIWSFNSLLQF